jgi:hypothetical protein
MFILRAGAVPTAHEVAATILEEHRAVPEDEVVTLGSLTEGHDAVAVLHEGELVRVMHVLDRTFPWATDRFLGTLPHDPLLTTWVVVPEPDVAATRSAMREAGLPARVGGYSVDARHRVRLTWG